MGISMSRTTSVNNSEFFAEQYGQNPGALFLYKTVWISIAEKCENCVKQECKLVLSLISQTGHFEGKVLQ
ncbi:MAG: hypothetical protein R2856_12965 [Caldilineaceae bacterium]